MTTRKLILAATAFLTALAPSILAPSPAYARFDCGRVQRAHYRLPSRYNLALNWADLPHVSPQPGAVVVQTRAGHNSAGGPGGHVSRILQITGSCRALVADEKGSYERDICSRLVAVVMPGAAAQISQVSGHRLRHRLVSGHRLRPNARVTAVAPEQRLE